MCFKGEKTERQVVKPKKKNPNFFTASLWFRWETPASEAPPLLLLPPRSSLNCPDLTKSLPVMQTRVTASAYMSILAPPLCQRTPLSKAHPADAVEPIGEQQEGGEEERGGGEGDRTGAAVFCCCE